MPSNATTAASFPRRNQSIDQVMKAGIGATACGVLILVIVLLAMHTVPLTIG
jgi:phosphomevalonate kinase